MGLSRLVILPQQLTSFFSSFFQKGIRLYCETVPNISVACWLSQHALYGASVNQCQDPILSAGTSR